MKLLKKLIIASVLAITSTVASADVLTFDGFTGALAGSGYGGFTWSNFNVLNSTNNDSGYRNGTVSGTNVAFNAYANPASFSRGEDFTLNSAYFTGAWNDGLTVRVVGTGTNNYVKEFVVNTTAPSNIVFNWTGLRSVSLSTSGGTPHPGYSGAGTHVALDNLTFNATPVPEPETYAMMIAGLAALGVVARRRKAA